MISDFGFKKSRLRCFERGRILFAAAGFRLDLYQKAHFFSKPDDRTVFQRIAV
jgi:hypothetical protein